MKCALGNTGLLLLVCGTLCKQRLAIPGTLITNYKQLLSKAERVADREQLHLVKLDEFRGNYKDHGEEVS